MKKPRFEIKNDEVGLLRVFLLAGNGAELARSQPVAKRGNGERTVERIRQAASDAQLTPNAEVDT